MKVLEKDIQNTICEYLQYRPNILFWRQNTAGIYDAQKQIMRKLPKFAMKGIPDICMISQGKYIGLEVKRPGEKQSEGQIEFQRRCEAAGGAYHVVTSLDDVLKLGI